MDQERMMTSLSLIDVNLLPDIITLTVIHHHISALSPVKPNPLRPNVAYLQRETFSFMMSHPAMSLGDRFCDSRKRGTGGGGWVHPKGANNMAVSGLCGRKVAVLPCGASISSVHGLFFSYSRLAFLGRLDCKYR